jgi:hydrogenase maturation protease
MNNRTLVMGVGNPILRDDGVGIHAVRELKKTLTGVDFMEESLSGLELIEQFRGYERVVIIDAVKTQGGVPGEMYHLTPDDMPTLHGLSPHDADFRTAIEYGKKFMGVMPVIEIYGIEVENVTEYGETLTAEVERSLPGLIERIKDKLKDGYT